MSALPKLTRDAFAKVLRDYACAWCGVVTRAEVLEHVDGDRVCPECADREHAEREAEENAYNGPLYLEEGWK